jgi:addiction module HigA family antidote
VCAFVGRPLVLKTSRSWTITDGEMMMRKLKPVTPGELLLEEFLKPMGISQYRLAKEIGVPAQRVGDIVAGKRAITADTDLRLCRFFTVQRILATRPSDARHRHC